MPGPDAPTCRDFINEPECPLCGDDHRTPAAESGEVFFDRATVDEIRRNPNHYWVVHKVEGGPVPQDLGSVSVDFDPMERITQLTDAITTFDARYGASETPEQIAETVADLRAVLADTGDDQ